MPSVRTPVNVGRFRQVILLVRTTRTGSTIVPTLLQFWGGLQPVRFWTGPRAKRTLFYSAIEGVRQFLAQYLLHETDAGACRQTAVRDEPNRNGNWR